MCGGGDGGGGGGGGQGGRGGWVEMREGWARWMVTAGGGGRTIQQGCRALGCGVLGGMLVICRRGVLLAFYSGASAAGSRQLLARKGTEHGTCCMLHVCPSLCLWMEETGLAGQLPVAVANCWLSVTPLPLLTRYSLSRVWHTEQQN